MWDVQQADYCWDGATGGPAEDRQSAGLAAAAGGLHGRGHGACRQVAAEAVRATAAKFSKFSALAAATGPGTGRQERRLR